jgi:Family of unknown function (DUF6502)
MARQAENVIFSHPTICLRAGPTLECAIVSDDSRSLLLDAAVETLRPLARRLLEAGMPFGELEARLRELFVHVAEKDLSLPGRRPTDSRVSLLTGINRKEVRRIRSADPERNKPASFTRNLAAGLVSRWLVGRRTTDARGRPRPIPYQAPRGPSFVALARQVTRDLPPRVILDELLRTGAAKRSAAGMIALRADAYVPKLGRSEKLAMLAEDPAELIETMLGNIFDEARAPRLQRKVLYDNLGADALPRLRLEIRRAGERFLRSIDKRMARADRDRNPNAPGGERRTAGVGLYYFERPGGGPPPAEQPTRARRRKE